MQIILIEYEVGVEETGFPLKHSWKLHSCQINFFQQMLALCFYESLTGLRHRDVVHQINYRVVEESLVRHALLNSVE